MEINYQIIGNRIKNYRRIKGVTQEKMAEDLYLSVGFISQLERGICKVSLDTLGNIAEYLECSIASILEGSNQPSSAFRQSEFLSLYEALSSEDQKLFFAMIEAYSKQKNEL